MDPNYISELAHLFRHHGDQVLCGDIKFSVSGKCGGMSRTKNNNNESGSNVFLIPDLDL